MEEIRTSLLKELDRPEAEKREIHRVDPQVFAAALSQIVRDDNLRKRLEENPVETITKELGLPLSKERMKLLEGRRLSDVSPPITMEDELALAPVAITGAAVAIWAGPIVACVVLCTEAPQEPVE